MDLKMAQAFVMVAEELHFTRAAERLEVAQPLVSQRVRKFEAELGHPVVERTTRAVKLTPAGEAALPHARQMVESARLMIRAAEQEGTPVLGSVLLGYAGASSRPWLPAIARAVRRQAAGVDLRLRSMVYAGSAPSLVAAGDLDIAFGRRPMTYTGLLDRVFEYERVLVGVPSDHRLAALEEIEIGDLEQLPWVMFPAQQGSSVRDMGLRLAGRAGFTPRVVQEAPDSYTILGLVAAGVGVTLTVSSVAHVETPGLALVPLAGPARYLTATLLHRRKVTPATQAVLDVLAALHPEPQRPEGLVLD
ncbi:LysR family transcriptional regulator [Citricoccus sp. I39-566]|uniref:LysR family transcriptional regulator n=1 Tax=Citricoccus sp. I39-566 TaxID=3073268 RepID=UPI00286ABE2E|nr:LysR family transcriptional regulator [Citricoccus sp. I39-566]WMY78989.1 LysR family transcriptional regulator [Citricoccus sp. I39-566]